MKIRRDIPSVPSRTAEETWNVISNLITETDSTDLAQFDAASTIMASLVTDESFKQEPLTLVGDSHRIVIYLLHGFDAIGRDTKVDPLPNNPTAGDWKLYVPCAEEDLGWVKSSLAKRAPRFIPIKHGDNPGDSSSDSKQPKSLEINWGVLTQ